MPSLREARCSFTLALAHLVLYSASQGYDVAFDEGKDTITKKDPTTDHMKGSLHEIGLAQDILLYVNGNYMTNTVDYEILGEWWEQHGREWGLPLVWGGRFNDGNHFAYSWGGKK